METPFSPPIGFSTPERDNSLPDPQLEIEINSLTSSEGEYFSSDHSDIEPLPEEEAEEVDNWVWDFSDADIVDIIRTETGPYDWDIHRLVCTAQLFAKFPQTPYTFQTLVNERTLGTERDFQSVVSCVCCQFESSLFLSALDPQRQKCDECFEYYVQAWCRKIDILHRSKVKAPTKYYFVDCHDSPAAMLIRRRTIIFTTFKVPICYLLHLDNIYGFSSNYPEHIML